jgi:hypothetical protein
VTKQGVEEAVVELGRVGGPWPFQAAGDGVGADAGTEAVLPTQSLQSDPGPFGFDPDLGGVAGAVGFAEGVAAGDQRDRLLVVHGHAREGLADVVGRGQRIRLAVRTFGIDVDQAHLDGGQRLVELALALVAGVAQPDVLGAPMDVLLGLPAVLTAKAEAEGLEAHGLHADVGGEDHQVGPADLVAVLLLDRPQQPAGLVEIAVVGPAVQRREALLAAARAAAPVAGAIGAGAVPSHPDEQRAIVAIVGRPPVLGVGDQRRQVALQGLDIQLLDLICVVERLGHRAGQPRMLVEDLQVQLVGPPVTVRPAAETGVEPNAMLEGALGRRLDDFGSVHVLSPFLAALIAVVREGRP